MTDIEKFEWKTEKYVKQLWVVMLILTGVAGITALLAGNIGAFCVVGGVVAGLAALFIRIGILSAMMTAMRITLIEEIRKSKE